MKSQTNSSNNNNFTPSHHGPSECHIGKSINPNNYYFNGSGKSQHQRSLANLPPQLSTRNSSCISSSNNNPNIINNNCNGSNNFHKVPNTGDTKNFNDASFLTAYHHSLSPLEGPKSAINNSINNNHHNTPLGSKNYNNTTTTTTTATVPNMLLVRPANNPSSLHIGTFPFLPVQFF